VEPVVTGPLKRSERFVEKYRKWLSTGKAVQLSDIILRSYFDVQVKREPEIDVGIYQERGIEGIYIRNNKHITKEEFHFLLEFLREQILKIDYRKYHGITDAREERGKIRSREEYYFKPILENFDYPVKQSFGNLTLELNIVHNEVQYLKIAATTYAGFNYQEPEPFHELMVRLFPEK
jgi:hypothetical protein